MKIMQGFVKRWRLGYKKINQRVYFLRKKLNQSQIVDTQRNQLIKKLYPPNATTQKDIAQYQKTLEKSIPSMQDYRKLYPNADLKSYQRFKTQYMDRGFYRWVQKDQINRRMTGKDTRHAVKEDVGRIAGSNGPVRLKQDAYGNYPQFNHQVSNSKGEGINMGKNNMNTKNGLMGKSGKAQQPRVYQAIQFGDQEENFQPLGGSGYGDDRERYRNDNDNILDMPQTQDDAMFDALVKGEQQDQYMNALRQRDQRDIDRLFDQRTRTQSAQHALPNTKRPITGEQRTQHSSSQNMQTNWVVPQSAASNKPLISQGMDAQQMYDLMQSFMIQENRPSQNYTNRYTPGIDPGYDVR